ncbi:MAG: hypothetical protein K0R51_1287 [Cytophagaceae bacterium]|nr:hypothetical protein [Cytophagaceae bacterium]
MKKVFYTVLASLMIVFTSHAQSDSLSAIEQQQQELRLQQLRLQAKQDSLQKEQDRISAEKLKAQQQQQQTQVVTPVEAEDYNYTVIALHPMFAMLGQADFSIEQRITKTTSLYLEFAYHDFNLRENGTVAAFMPGDWIAYTGYRAELQLRYYVLPEARALYQLYLAPHIYFKQDEVSRGEGNELSNNNGQRRQYEYYNQYQGQALGAGLNLGYQFQFLRHLTFDTSVGTSYSIPLTNKMLTDRAHLPLINPYKEGMMLRMNLSLGFAF